MGGISSGQPGEASARSSIVTLINSCVGVGVLSLPYAFRAAGWAGGLALLAFVAFTEAFTLYVLSRYAEHTDATTYSTVVRRMLGKKASMCLAAVLLIYLFGSCVAYLIILADCLHPIVASLLGAHWYTQRNVVLTFFSSTLMFPLCLPRTLDSIVTVSAVALYGIVAMVGIVSFRNLETIAHESDPWGQVQALNWSLDFLAAVPIVIFGMQCHCQVITVFHELEDRPRVIRDFFPIPSLRLTSSVANFFDAEATAAAAATTENAAQAQSGKSKKLRGMRRVVMTAISLTAVGYAAIGLTGYLAFPHSAQSNILNNFSTKDLLMQVCRGLVGLMKVVSYPINHHPARSCTQDVLRVLTGRPLNGTLFHVGHAVVFFVATLSVALSVTDLGSVFKVVGGTNGAVLIFGLPGAMLMKYAYDKAQQSREATAVGPAAPLLAHAPAADGQAPGREEPYRLVTSKLWWAGIGLVALCLFVLALTVVSMVYPMRPGTP